MTGFVVHNANAPEGSRIEHPERGWYPADTDIVGLRIVREDDEDPRFRYLLKNDAYTTNPVFPSLKSFVLVATPENVRMLRDLFKEIGGKKTAKEIERDLPWAFTDEPRGIFRFLRR